MTLSPFELGGLLVYVEDSPSIEFVDDLSVTACPHLLVQRAELT